MKRNTLYYGDCLEVMKEWHGDCVNLIYLDPPFNSNTNDNILFGNKKNIAAAINLQREFIGIDISMYALDVIQKKRLKNIDFKIDGVPAELSSAEDMASKRQFAFEKWAIHCSPTVNKWDASRVKECIATAGKLKHGATEFNRLVMCSIEEHFKKVKPELPTLADPQTDLMTQEELPTSSFHR